MTSMFTCSIDDGHPSDMRLADMLHKHGLNATFYVPIKNSENYPVMSRSQIREIGSAFEIGSHTYDHCFLANLNLPQARYQVMAGKQKLEDILGRPVNGFCYPGGKYRSEHIELVKQAGFYYARTTKNLCFSPGEDRFEIPTTCQFYPHNKSVYIRNFIRSMQWQQRHPALRIMLQKDNWIDRIYALFDYANEHGLVFHLWIHSHNIDDLNLWAALDYFFSYVSDHICTSNRISNKQLVARVFH
jgi:peptidoglycan/xylan/chitin deacetylase (PgdA/CDA1 family)